MQIHFPTTAKDAAEYLIWFASSHEDCVTNMKVQKLLYYAQGWYLALHDGKRLFSEDFQAWPRGPVIPYVYGFYRHERIGGERAGWEAIPPPDTEPNIPDDIKEYLRDIWREFGRFSATDLEEMTHTEPPWQNARRGLGPTEPSNNTISVEDMRVFFEKLAAEIGDE